MYFTCLMKNIPERPRREAIGKRTAQKALYCQPHRDHRATQVQRNSGRRPQRDRKGYELETQIQRSADEVVQCGQGDCC